MRENHKIDENIDFVARHYRAGAFSVSSAWRRMHIARSHWFGLRSAAAIAAVVVLTASACVWYWMAQPANVLPPEPAPLETDAHVTPIDEVRRIEFTDAPLAVVIADIETVYGVTIVGMPDREYRLTLSYEGTAADLVGTINELLGTELAIEP